MLLELLTGRRPVDKDQTYMDDSLVEWVSVTIESLYINKIESFVCIFLLLDDNKVQQNSS